MGMVRQREMSSNTNNQQQQSTSLKYWLFDLAIVSVCVFVSVSAVLPAGRSFSSFSSSAFGDKHRPHLDVNGNGNDANDPPVGHCTEGVDTPDSKPMFVVGDMVEVYEPKIHPNYAFHAKISNVHHINKENRCSENDPGESVYYDVRVGFGLANGYDTYEKIGASSVRPMMPFEPKTRAMCDRGSILNIKLVPCTIDSHVPNTRHFFGKGSNQNDRPQLYSVSSLKDDGVLLKRQFPVTRIRRIMREPCEGDDNQDGIQEVSSPASPSRMPQDFLPSVTSQATAPKISDEEDSRSKEDNFPVGTVVEDSRSKEDNFPVGTVVEIYRQGNNFGFPATVTGVNHGMNKHQHPLTKYNLIHGITHSHMKNVDPQFVHPYQIYQEGQEASCNVGTGKLHEIMMVNCTIISAIKKSDSDDDIVYQVSAKMLDSDADLVIFLPIMKVQRRMERFYHDHFRP